MKTKLVPGKGRLPYPAYRGKEPYIFVSYAHVDSQLVFEEIRRFNEMGFHVWYDEGITPGNEWTDEIAEALSGCSLFILMVTPRSATRINVQNEVNYALDEDKPFLAIHLEETTLQGGMKLRTNTKQAILKYMMTEEEYVWKLSEGFKRLGLTGRSGGGGQPDVPPHRVPPYVPPKKNRWLLPVLLAVALAAGLCLYAFGPWKGGDDRKVEATEAATAGSSAAEIPEVTDAPAETKAPEVTDAPEAAAASEGGDGALALTAIDPLADVSGLSAGDIVSFGHYEQDNEDNGAEAIEWIVLEADDSRAVLLSRYALDCKPYNDESVGVTWEACTLRQWLNGEFLEAAFSPEERDRLETAAVRAEKNPNYSFTDPGNDTRDTVYLLSASEVQRYFPADGQRVCPATRVAVSRGVSVDEESQGAKWWWLRTPGFSDNKAVDVFSDGSIRYGGDLVDLAEPVRPVITLRLSAEKPEATEVPEATPEPTEAPTPEPTEAPTPEPTEEPAPEPTEAPVGPVSAAGILPSVEVTGPVMRITLFNGETIEGPLSSVRTYFTQSQFQELYLAGITYLSQTRDEETNISHFGTDDPFNAGIDWDLSYMLSSFNDPDELDQSFSISTADGTRLISMYNVSEITVGSEDETLTVVREEEYERPETQPVRGGTNTFAPSGTVRVYMRDGTAYTSFPEAFSKIVTANTYMDVYRHPDWAQTRDFWIEEAETLYFSGASEDSSEDFGYFMITGELSGGEPVRKFIHANGNNMRIFTLEKGIVPLTEYDIDRIEVDTSATPDFSKIRTGRVTLTDGTVYELPVTAMEYNHYEGGGFVRPHPTYDYCFLTGSAEFDSSTGYAEEERELPFSTLKEIEFSDREGLGDREFPATVTYRDGQTEALNFRFYNYYGNALELYCPGRISIDLDDYVFCLSKIEFG